MTKYAGEVRIKTWLDASGITQGVKKVSASLKNAGAVAADFALRAAAGTVAIAGGIATVARGIEAISRGIALIVKDMMKMEGFKEKFSELDLALNNLQNAVYSALMPLIEALLPSIMQMVTWLTNAANAAAAFFAKLTGASTYSVYVAGSLENTAGSSGKYADNMERAEKAAKGSLASFDKLNVLNKQEEPETPGAGGSGGGGGSGEWVEKGVEDVDLGWLDELQDNLFLIEVTAKAIGAAILAWGISKLFGLDLSKTIGFMLIAAGAVLLVYGAFDALENGVDWDNLTLMVGGLALVFGGLWIAFGLTVAAIGLVIGGIALLAIGIMDWVKKGELSTQTFWLLEAAIIAVGVAFAILVGWPALIIAAIIALALAVYKNWEKIKTWSKETWEKIKEIWGKVATWFKEKVVQPIVDFFSPILNIISIIFYDLWLLVKYVWKKVASWFKENVIDPIIKFFKELWEDIKSIWGPVFSWFKDNVIDPIVTAWDTAISKIGEFFSSMWDGVKEGAKSAINWVIEKLNGFLNGIGSGINNLIGKWNSVPIPGWISIPLIEVPQIPYLATGAVIPPNAPFAAILGDQRSGVNVEAPLDTIVKAFEQALLRHGLTQNNTNGGVIHNQITLSGRVIYEEIKKIDRQIGNSMVTTRGMP